MSITCEQHECREVPVAVFIWPGNEPLLSCMKHALSAVLIAKHMGFILPLLSVETVLLKRAKRAVELLQSDEA